MAQASLPLKQVIQKVQSMVHDNQATKIVENEKYSIHSVTWEDCARNKGSVWGPCISDMTLQVGSSRMPVIRENNFTDTTWDVEIDKIPIVIGNEKMKGDDKNSNNKLETISLKEYLQHFDQYMSDQLQTVSKNNNNSFPMNAVSIFDNIDTSKQSSINLLRKDDKKDSHVIVSSQACFLPIETGNETLFNVALFNYQSKKQDPAILAIVATSKGTSAQIIEGSDQKLLFNKNGTKADFVGQRLTDNRIERGVKNLNAPMTTQEKQDNCIVIIQVPLKQKPQIPSNVWGNNGYNGDPFAEMEGGGGMEAASSFGFLNNNNNNNSNNNDMYSPQLQMGQSGGFGGMNMNMNNSMNSISGMSSNSTFKSRSFSKQAAANVESAIVKVAPKTHPVCKCGDNLEKLQLQFCYSNYGKSVAEMTTVNCDGCGILVVTGSTEAERKTTIVWHCKKEKTERRHKNGYDLCGDCADKQLQFSELNGVSSIVRDEKYPIRVTLQYYKSTDNGVINKEIMKVIAKQLKTSQKQSDYVGSLVTQFNSQRPTEWVQYKPFKLNNTLSVNENYSLVRDVLGNLELSEYFTTFVNNQISDSRLVLLDESDLKTLFNRLGPLVVFRHWLRSFKETNVNGIVMKNNGNNSNDDQKVDFGMGLFVSKD